MNLMSASKYMTYNSLFNVSSFLQTSSASHHSPSSSSSCSSNSSTSFSPNSSINAQCLSAPLNHSALLTPAAAQSGSRYLSNSSHLPFPSGFSASPSSFLRAGSPSPSDLQSLSQLTLAQARLAAAVAGNAGSSGAHHEPPVSGSQATTSPQVTSLALKQAALAALQARQQTGSTASGPLSNSAEPATSLLANAGQPYPTSNYSPPSKSSFSPPKSFYYSSLKSASAFQQPTSSSPNLEIMNLSPQAYGAPNGQFEHAARAPSLNAGLPRNLPNSPDSKLPNAASLRGSPIQLTNLDADHCPKSGKRAANRQGKAVRNKSNHKDEFGFSKVQKSLISRYSLSLCPGANFCVLSKLGLMLTNAAHDLTLFSFFPPIIDIAFAFCQTFRNTS